MGAEPTFEPVGAVTNSPLHAEASVEPSVQSSKEPQQHVMDRDGDGLVAGEVELEAPVKGGFV